MNETDRSELVHAAALNNAELCDVVSRTHGAVGQIGAEAWTSARRTPMYYPDAVTLKPGVDARELLARIDSSSGASVKDSFAALDLHGDGFRILFTADWIVREPQAAAPADVEDGVRWLPVVEADELEAWETGWSDDGVARGLFRPELLEVPDLVVLSVDVVGEVVAGAIATRSASVVGVSNVFTTNGDVTGMWAGCLDEISQRYPGLPIVGYESVDALTAARAAGFEPIGQLRVWIKD